LAFALSYKLPATPVVEQSASNPEKLFPAGLLRFAYNDEIALGVSLITKTLLQR
jgi:hypothetical protein